jgi:hypothetical protein
MREPPLRPCDTRFLFKFFYAPFLISTWEVEIAELTIFKDFFGLAELTKTLLSALKSHQIAPQRDHAMRCDYFVTRRHIWNDFSLQALLGVFHIIDGCLSG